MFNNLEDIQKFSKDRMDVATRAATSLTKGVQQIAAESADYSKRSLEEGTAALEQLFGAKSIDKAFEIQTNYCKSAYEGFVAQATKIGELYTSLAKEAFRPAQDAVGAAKTEMTSAH